MAGKNAADVRIAITGRLLSAPLGSTAPVDVVSGWAAAWNDHGYLDPGGVSETPKVTPYEVKAWQADSSIRSRIIERGRDIQVKLIQAGGLNSVLYNGGGSWAQIPTRSVSDGVLNGTTTVTSATAVFVTGDVGATIAGVGIPAGATIVTRTSGTSVVISAAATISATGVTIAIGAVGTYQYTPPTPGVDDVRMLGIEWTDGTITKREVYPNVIVTAVGASGYKASQEIQYDVTFTVQGDNWYTLSNDPADNPAALVA